MEKQKNYNGIDVIKLLMALCVVIIHLTPFATYGENADFIFDIVLTRAAVPFFFCSSGFFLKMKLDRVKSNIEFRMQVMKFAKRIMFMYIIWTIIYLPCIIFWFKVDNENVLSFVQKCIFDGSYLHLMVFAISNDCWSISSFTCKKIRNSKEFGYSNCFIYGWFVRHKLLWINKRLWDFEFYQRI